MHENKNHGGTPNRLMQEKSPYLLQHALNPVDWFAWGPEAFSEARRRDLPILLSIGYSTCHWCHVMERESFEDPETAALMNTHFVNIKVDREERPDLDAVYMAVAQMMNGNGGWPLTILMTPEKKPFFSGTYLPKTSRFGRMGMLELIGKVHQVWTTKREDVETSAREISSTLQNRSLDRPGSELAIAVLDLGYSQLSQRFDAQQGGFGSSPKFPTPHNILFLLRYWLRTGNAHALEMAEKTLVAMRMGGIYDHVGFGFHRYATDANWFLPHFEKMLYDQAMLIMAYTEAYEATGKHFYAQTAHEIITYVLRDMTDAQGGFYSAEDADSEGEEGKFNLWTSEEIKEALGEAEWHWVMKTFNLRGEGNAVEEASGAKTGSNHFHLMGDLDAMVNGREALPDGPTWEKLRRKLFEIREQRMHPLKDDKILTDWNGLMIAALSKAGRALKEPAYLQAAHRSANFILNELGIPGGRLLHRYRQGDAGLPAHSEDYAFMIWGLLELYESIFDVTHLQTALELQALQIQHYWDEKMGGFFLTAGDGELLLVRPKEVYDGAIPSGNSVSFLNLLRLARITGRIDLEEKAAQMARVFSHPVSQTPMAQTFFLSALDFAFGPSFEVVISGELAEEDTQSMIAVLRARYQPNKVVLLRTEKNRSYLAEIAPYTFPQLALGNKATAYVCQNHVCNQPTTEPKKMDRLLFGETQIR